MRMKNVRIAVVVVAWWTSAWIASAQSAGEAGAPREMVEVASRFLASLSPEQKSKAALPFESDERLNWHFVPKVRAGLPFKEIDSSQSALANALLSMTLSSSGATKVGAIMSLETILRELESPTNPNAAMTRDAGKYYFAVFGEPSLEKPWGWRIEGHHVSLNVTMVDGKWTASSPAFIGANPHEVRGGPRAGLRPLAAEEDLGRELIRSLDSSQLARAIISPEAPPDIFTGSKRKAEIAGPVKGLPRSAMSDLQRQHLARLIDEYVDTMHPYLAERRREKLNAMSSEEWDQVHFAWMGGIEKGQAHYYRVQAPKFLIEYDNIQNDANHSHTVWRDFEGDFGLDLLALHHKRDHAAPFAP